MRHALRTLIIPVAVAAAGGTVLAAAGPAAAGSATPACTVTWTGGGPKVLWNIAQNWSTNQVPGPSSDVCMSSFAFVTATGPIRIHSLQLGEESTVTFSGTASRQSQVRIATVLDNAGNVELDNAVLSVPRLDNGNGLESIGTSVLTSPAFHNGGTVAAESGSLTLTDSLAQLSNGTLASGIWLALGGTLLLPGDVTSLSSGEIALDTGSAIDDPARASALARLGSIGPAATLALTGSLSLAGSLTADGTVELGGYAGSGDLTVAGTLTQAHGSLAMSSQSTLTARAVTVGQHASLFADGTLVGNLVNNGSVSPEYHLSVTGNYAQAAGATLSAGFVGELMVGGKATLAGSLVSHRVPPPAPGTRGTAITFASVSGGFTGHSLGFNIVTGANQIGIVAQTQIAAAAGSVARGASETVNGGDFGLDSNVTVFLDRAGGTALGTARASVYGDVIVTGTIPSSLPTGTHKLIAVGSDGRRAQTTITVS